MRVSSKKRKISVWSSVCFGPVLGGVRGVPLLLMLALTSCVLTGLKKGRF